MANDKEAPPVLAAEQWDAAEHHEQGEERWAVHWRCSEPGQKRPEAAAWSEEPGWRGILKKGFSSQILDLGNDSKNAA